MAEEVLLPQWSMEMTEGVVLGWLKKEGDFVQRGDPLVEIETDKLNTELESPASGVLLYILVQEGETARVGNPVAVIAAPGEVIPRPAPIIETKPVSGTYAISGMSVKSSTESMPLSDSGFESMRIVPAARRLAREHDVDL